MIRVLLGTGPAEAGGSQLQLALLARELQKRGWPVRFVVGHFGQKRRARTAEGIELIASHGDSALPKGLRFMLYRVPRLWRALGRAGADVYVHQGVGWGSGLVAAFCRLHGVKCVIRIGSRGELSFERAVAPGLPKDQLWTAYGFRRAHAITVQTQEQLVLLRDRVRRHGVLLPNVWLLPDNVVPSHGQPQVLWAARIEGVKRPHMLLDVAEKLPDTRFIMAGGRGILRGDSFDVVRTRAEAMRNVVFRGFVPPDELDAEYVAAAVLACTSETEGFPNTFLQAWGHARPVVSTFDPDEVICRERIGVHCNTVEDIARAVGRICGNRAEADAMGARGRAYVKANHSPKVVIPRLERLLHDLVRADHGQSQSGEQY